MGEHITHPCACRLCYVRGGLHCVGIFCASDFTIASRMLGGMFGRHAHGDAILSTRELLQIGSVTLGMVAMHWVMRDNTFETAVMRLPPLGGRGDLVRDGMRYHCHSRKQ